MHIPENVQITIPVVSTSTNGFDRTDSERGVVLVSAAAATDSVATTASKANAADQQIIGTVGGEGDIAKVKGEIVMQLAGTAAMTAAQMQAGIIGTTATAGKVGASTVAKFAAGEAIKVVVTRQGNDPTIGRWIAVIL